MANFTKLENEFLPNDGDWYKVDGIITEEDIKKINSIARKTILVIENTKGLSSKILSEIKSNNISFSVIGGLDYFNKEKYKTKKYIARTMVSCSGLTEIIKYYENIESQIKPEWTDTQKCMFLYDALARDFSYEENYKTQIQPGIAERGLNGIIYKKLVCAGFAMVLKEGLDRIGINNIYQNRKGHHSWNIVELDGKLRGIELTWDCYNKGADNVCQFRYFGQDSNFYENKSHKLSQEIWELNDTWEDWEETAKKTTIHEEETQYDLTPFTIEELKTNLRVISQAINSRQVNQNPLFNSSEEEKKLLPIDTLRDSYQRESVKEKKYIMLYSFLQKNGLISKNQYNFLKIRNAYISDVIGTLPSSLTYTNSSHFCGSDIDISSLADCNFYSDGSYYTPFGVKRIIAQQETENITNSTELNSVFMKLQTRMNQYTINYLINLLNNSETLLEEYKKIQSIEVEKDFNISLVEADLFTKLKSLTMSKELLISSGISQEIIQQKLESIEQYFNDITKKNTFTESEQREQDLDFLLGVLGDTKEVRQICEQHDGHRFTEEEWNTKSVNVQYMMQVFDKLKQMNIKPENIQIALNELFSNKDISAEKNRK